MMVPTVVNALIAAKRPTLAAAVILTAKLSTACAAVLGALWTTSYIGPVIDTFVSSGAMLPARLAVYNTLFVASGKTHLSLIRMLIALGLNLILTLVLTSWMGYIGATSATILVIYFFLYFLVFFMFLVF
jgi:O-antigen/teichoic acid export membrane protein